MSRASRVFVVLLVAGAAAGCSETPPTTPSPVPVAPTIACPATQTAQSLTGGSVSVIFPAPVVTGAAVPLTTTCKPASGSTFTVGTTSVACTVQDVQARAASCTFNVTVTAPPTITATKFTAFGDSITEGKIAAGSLSKSAISALPCTPIPRSTSYPVLFLGMLQQRYTTQASQFVVSNQGCGGEEASGPGVSGNPGYLRLPAVLDAESPQALLLLEGANDLVNGDQPTLLPALTTMVQTARSRRIVVFIGTLLPQRANGSPARSSPQSVALVVPTNDQIKSMALTQGAILVDLYQAFGGSPDPYIDVDGLHPTNEGHKVIAQTFFDAVRKNLEAGP